MRFWGTSIVLFDETTLFKGELTFWQSSVVVPEHPYRSATPHLILDEENAAVVAVAAANPYSADFALVVAAVVHLFDQLVAAEVVGSFVDAVASVVVAAALFAVVAVVAEFAAAVGTEVVAVAAVGTEVVFAVAGEVVALSVFEADWQWVQV